MKSTRDLGNSFLYANRRIHVESEPMYVRDLSKPLFNNMIYIIFPHCYLYNLFV